MPSVKTQESVIAKKINILEILKANYLLFDKENILTTL